jgi:hypothetical protein
MTTVNERFVQLIKALGMNNNSFAKSLGKTHTTVTNITDSKSKPGFELLETVLEHYPDVNPEWLILGKGEMMRGTASVPSEHGGDALEAELRERVNLQSQMIADLRYTVELQKRLLEGKKPEGAIERPLWPEECIEIGASAMLA